MKSEIFIDYGFRLKRKSKRIYRKSLKSIVEAKYTLISCVQRTNHYCSEINIQSKIFFGHNLKNINRFKN